MKSETGRLPLLYLSFLLISVEDIELLNAHVCLSVDLESLGWIKLIDSLLITSISNPLRSYMDQEARERDDKRDEPITVYGVIKSIIKSFRKTGHLYI